MLELNKQIYLEFLFLHFQIMPWEKYLHSFEMCFTNDSYNALNFYFSMLNINS